MTSTPHDGAIIRVAVHSDRRLFGDTLAMCLQAQPEYDVVGHTTDVDDLVELCELRHPDVVLVALDGGQTDRPDCLAGLQCCAAHAPVVVVHDHLSGAALAALTRLGVDTVVSSSHGLAALLAVLHRYLAEEAPTPTPYPRGGALTELERRILGLVSAGHTVGRIAEMLEISNCAVTNAKRRIYHKLAVASQSQAVARAAALGITPTVQGPTVTYALPELTSRECDVLRSIADGHTIRQTGRALGIAEKTVENTQARLFRKLGARNRSGALSTAHALGLLQLVAPVAATPDPIT